MNGFFDDSLRARTYYDLKLQTDFTERDKGDALNLRLNGRGNAVIGSASLTRYQAIPVLDSYIVLKLSGQGFGVRVNIEPNNNIPSIDLWPLMPHQS
ncbi:MAG: hypothetical protein ABGY08_06620 [Gammaproteobacteria bacterium]|jgi:hypothetical protein|nr:hypothetical protein [Gammaproteobacteria bacterium]